MYVYNKFRCSKQFQKLIVGLKKRSLLAFGKCDDLGLLSMNKLRMTKITTYDGRFSMMMTPSIVRES